MFAALKEDKENGTYLRKLKQMVSKDLIIIDDFGLAPFDDITRLILLDLLEDRYDRKSHIIISQIPIPDWFDIIGDSTIADAVLDRIVHNAIKIELNGESIRKQKSENN